MTAARAPVFHDVDPRDLAVPSDWLGKIFRDEIDGLVVRNALPTPLVEGAWEGCRRLAPIRAPAFPGHTYGSVLVVADTLDAYFEAADAVRSELEAAGALAQVLASLRGLAGGAPVEVPTAADGRRYAALTVRVLEAGQDVAVHSEQWSWTSMEHLRTLIDPSTHLSLYVPLVLPESGGELVVYHRPHAPPRLDGLSPEQARAMLEPHGSTRWNPGAGDLLVFNGGRFNHRVVEVGGARPRVTLGGFAARSRDRTRVLLWS